MKQMILTALMCAVAVPYSAVALHISVEDFELFAVQGNTFYGFSNNLTDREILFLPTISDQNHLAVDPARNRILFLQNAPLGPAQHILWEYDFDSDTFAITGTIGVSNLIAGGATFYNGSYYLYDDGVENRVVKVNFDASGQIFSKSVFATGAGINLGDIATDTLRAKMYIMADNSDFYSLDINNPNAGFSLVGNLGFGTGIISQLAFDSRGRLIASGPTLNQWQIINPLTATSVATIPVPFPTTGLFDLATGAAQIGRASCRDRG